MAGAYAYTPKIWAPLLGAAFLAAMGLYAWWRRDVPAGKPFAAVSLLGSLVLVGIAFQAAAVRPETKIAWYQFESVVQMFTVTAATCFSLEYVYPGRWLSPRNVALLALPPLLLLLLVLVEDSQLVWRSLQIQPDGSIVPYFAIPGAILLAYAWGLVFVNMAAFLWLFIRSPQHRWPAAIMLYGQLAGRATYLFYVANLPPLAPPLDSYVFAFLFPWTAYAIALFGFRILDPLPAAREAVLRQMHAGVVVFDTKWRVVSLNPAAETILGTADRQARGKTWQQLTPPGEYLPMLNDGCILPPGREAELPEMSLGTGPNARHYAPALTELRDFRGLLIGQLLMLRDVTRERRAQAQNVQQQRSLAVLEERGRLGRELHDSLGQVLAAAHLQANAARRWLHQGQDALMDECLARLSDTTLEAEADVRDYLLAAKTVMSPGRPFFPTLREYLLRFSRQCDLPLELTVTPELEAQGLPEDVELQLFRIIQEALSNVRKHARATCAQVIFSQPGPLAQIVIVDDGRGFDPATIDSSGQAYGLQSMADRAEAAGGSLNVVSSPGQGTRVMVQVPFRRRADENPSS